MGAGSRFSINDGISLEFKVNSHLYSCTSLWYGIVVGPTSSLAMTTTTVEDAKFAVTMTDDGALNFTGCHFYNNYVGIYAPALSGGNVHFAQMWVLSNCDFASQRILLPAYNDLPPVPLTAKYGYAGMLFYDVERADLLTVYFSKLSNGIRAYRSLVDLSDFTMTDIENQQTGGSQYYPNTEGLVNPQSGYGIFAEGLGKPGASFKIHPGGQAAPHFYHCVRAVRGQRINLDVQGVTADQVVDGVQAYLQTGGQYNTHVVDNTINARNSGISMYFSANSRVKIYNNTIDLAGSTLPNTYGNAILFSLVNSLVPNVGVERGHIERNFCYHYQRSRGITLKVCNSIRVFNNAGFINQPIENDGILVDGFASSITKITNYFSNNDITGQSSACLTTAKVNGMRVLASPNNLICCNHPSNTFRAFSIEGNCGAKNRFRGNAMNTHKVGVYINAVGALDVQTHQGNLWNGGIEITGALHQNLFTAGQQKFYVHTNTPPIYPDPAPNPPGWFEVQQGTPFACASTDDFCGFQSGEPYPAFSDFDRSIADGTYQSPAYQQGITYTAQHDMLVKMWGNPTLINSGTAFQSLWNSSQGQALGRLSKQGYLMDGYGRFSTQNQASFDQNAADIAGLWQQVNAINLQLRTETNPSVIANLQGQRTQFFNNMGSLEADNANIVTAQTSGDQSILTQAQAENNAVSTSIAAAVNEKTLNNYRYALLNGSLTELSSAQVSELNAIAGQCPISGGNAVFVARSLLMASLATDDVWDDYALCPEAGFSGEQPGGEERGKTSSFHAATDLRVWPNPSDGALHIECPATRDGLLTLTDAQGKLLWRKEMSVEDGGPIEVPPLSPGLYFLTLSDAGRWIATSKVIVPR